MTEHNKILIIGTGKSGIAAAGLLLSDGRDVILFDENRDLSQESVRDKVLAKTQELCDLRGVAFDRDKTADGIFFLIGADALSNEMLSDVSEAVISPGVPTDGTAANRIREAGIRLTGEIELAWRYEKGRVLAITGTNGKTTTTSLLGKIMEKAAPKTLVVGNIGIPYTEMALASTQDSVTVAEISSFQLETTDTFHPSVSAILNLTPDHLNRHHTMENYVKAKQDITKAQTKSDVCVLNAEDPYTEAFLSHCPARVVLFSSKRELEDGFYLRENVIYRAQNGQSERLIAMEETNLLGDHNAENIMAAVAMADAAGVAMDVILDAVRAFHAVEHRIEFVKNVSGVDYYNDSKGTNPDAAIKAISAMVRPTWLIGGGYDKDSTYDEWIESFGTKVRGLVLIGQTAEKIAACARKHGFEDIYMADDLKAALQLCHDKAQDGEAVLLSPACASWGMFDNYEQRGDQFKEIVREF